MWLFPSMGRAKAAQAVVDTCWNMGMRQTAVLFVDGDPDDYHEITLPQNWKMFAPGRRVGLTEAMNWAYREYPKERCYGWLADDTFPETMGFSDIIEEETGMNHFVCCYDNWLMGGSDKDKKLVMRGALMTSGLCWGRSLLRAAGWWAYPSITQVGIDWIWTELLKDTGVSKYLPFVTVRHDNFRTERREYDYTDEVIYKQDYKHDFWNAKQFIHSNSFANLRKKIAGLSEVCSV